MIRVIIADDHNLVRKGIRALLEKSGEVQIVAEADNGADALKLTAELTPDVLLLDIRMPRLDGAQALQQLRARKLKTQVVILSMFADAALVRQCLRDGARGYLVKESLTEELELAVRAASQHQTFISPLIAEPITADARQTPAPTLRELLTPREREILQLLVEGRRNNAIARTLSISARTVEKHRASIMKKLDVRDLPTLVRYALEHKLIFFDE